MSAESNPADLASLLRSFGNGALPFAGDDVTAGSEHEYQTAVIGHRTDADLPRFIEESSYYDNIRKRAARGDASRKLVTGLEGWLDGGRDDVWENSWVRFPASRLSPAARRVFERDLLADKRRPEEGPRGDVARFIRVEAGEETLRLPVSYLLKLAVADIDTGAADGPLARAARSVMERYINDNTSPEVISFSVSPVTASEGMGATAALDAAKKHLMTQLLADYANVAFGLAEAGQRVVVYSAPHPPVRQKRLNSVVSDAFYRELFMSPCLSGWDRGEEKSRYMSLCHETLSRSQLNAIGKLKEAGIITRDLVTLPRVSNLSLANNGVHVSLGSATLNAALADPASGFGPAQEKRLGDLVIKIVEHFLPLFVGTLSAAPYRLDFPHFHPEELLGFLPHELDYTHLRMLWRRWRKKAQLKIFGQPVTPFGPRWFDELFATLFRLKGDFVPDFRLVDYPACLMSPDRAPALDGTLGNTERARADLASLGVFDHRMSFYLLYKLRAKAEVGFSGFEGRHYSLFADFSRDFADAVTLQTLVTALAYRWAVTGAVTHADIPDDPLVESERRQIFFGAAVEAPTFYVDQNTPNRLLARLVAATAKTRASGRYAPYTRVQNIEYRRALLRLLASEGADLVERFGCGDLLARMAARVDDPSQGASGKLTQGILDTLGAKNPLSLSSDEFNRGAEGYFRNGLRRAHTEEALALFAEEARRLDACSSCDGTFRAVAAEALGHETAAGFLARVRGRIADGTATKDELAKMITLLLATVSKATAAAPCAR
ncbi:MAG: hypothetical protein HQK87_06120 [Nitrospinae bacterium]|nr:hypothetical protein [Nitrospinota bacterium]